MKRETKFDWVPAAEYRVDLDVAAVQELLLDESFSTRAMALDLRAIYGRRRPTPGVGYFFSRP